MTSWSGWVSTSSQWARQVSEVRLVQTPSTLQTVVLTSVKGRSIGTQTVGVEWTGLWTTVPSSVDHQTTVQVTVVVFSSLENFWSLKSLSKLIWNGTCLGQSKWRGLWGSRNCGNGSNDWNQEFGQHIEANVKIT